MTQAPPSYKTIPSEEHLANVTAHLTIDEKRDLTKSPSITSIADTDITTASTPEAAAANTDRHAVVADDYNHAFHATKTLVVHAKGMALLRLPMPSHEMEIAVTNLDGTLAYVSTREKYRSGNAVLSSPTGGNLVASYYKFGPGRPPTLQLLKSSLPATTVDNVSEGGKITTSGKWTSRTLDLKLADTSLDFSWRYRHERLVQSDDKVQTTKDQYQDDGSSGNGNLAVDTRDSTTTQHQATSSASKRKQKKKRTALVLEVAGATKDDKPVRIAQLLRNRETRTQGTKRCTAGNGGHLLVDETASREAGLAEEVVVATCIMMLKREMDRRRAVQLAMIAGAAGGH